jgi:hypothetical protein
MVLRSRHLAAALLLIVAAAIPRVLVAQEADPLPVKPDTTNTFANTFTGEFNPGAGYTLIKTKRGSLNVSVYGLFRYMNQYAVGDSFTDHLGRKKPAKPRNDLNWQRTFAWISGFFYDPKFLYTISLWSLPTTQQTLLFGNFQYRMSKPMSFGIGITPNLTARSVQGSWPYWAATDRQMAEEYFRGGFSSGVFVTGQPVQRLQYTLSINNNISQLGVIQANDTPQLSYSVDFRWQPTTGEFGARNGLLDFEFHTRAATQFGTSAMTSRESRYAPNDQPPNNTQIRISDGLNVFELGALADAVTVQTLTYNYLSFDAGVKYRGNSIVTEYYFRRLNQFVADGPLPLTSIFDNGFMVELTRMVIPQTLGVYAVTGYVFDQFKRHPWELSAGFDYFPSRSRSWRLNAHYIHIVRSPTGSFFGYYTPGQTGTTYSLALDILL